MVVTILPCALSVAFSEFRSADDFDEGKVEITPCDASTFLEKHSGVPYSAFVTLDEGRAVPTMRVHGDRLFRGMQRLFPSAPVVPLSKIQELLLALLGLVAGSCEPNANELQVVPVVVFEEPCVYMRIHVSVIPDPRQKTQAVVVECRGGPRSDPNTKNTAWVKERKPLEAARSSDITETILVGVDSDGCHTLLEGLVSNFFVVTKNLQVWTAPKDLVLPGSLRECVVASCEAMGVQLEEKPVRLADFTEFEAAFITNARRYLVPVQTIRVPDPTIGGNCPRQVDLPSGQAAMEVIDKLRDQTIAYERHTATRL